MGGICGYVLTGRESQSGAAEDDLTTQPQDPSSTSFHSSLTVRATNLMLSEIKEHLAGSSTDGQLVLNLTSVLVDCVMKLEL